jgi:xylulokinase
LVGSGVRRRDPPVFMSKDLLRFKLTLAWHTDFSDAVGALLAESSTRGWSQELCEMVG